MLPKGGEGTSQEQPKATRKQPEAARSSQEQPGAARGSQGPGAAKRPRMNQKISLYKIEPLKRPKNMVL